VKSGPTRRIAYASWGYSTHDLRFVHVAVRHGWEVRYFRFDGGASSLCEEALPRSATFVDWRGSHTALSTESLGDFSSEFIRSLRVSGANLVQAGPLTSVALVATQQADVPVIATSWASDLLVDAASSAAMRGYASTAISRAHSLIVDSNEVAARAVDLGAIPERMLVLPWGVELDKFPYQPLRLVHERPLRLLSLRSLEPIYDIDVLIRAVALVIEERGEESVTLTLAGSGSLERDLKHLATELGVTHAITWLGRIPEREVPRVLTATDVHVSSSRSDGSSVSLLQAMAIGRPSVVTDIPSNREWVEEGEHGWLFSPGSEASLAEKILLAVEKVGHLPFMGQRVRRVAEGRANWVKNSELIPALYERTLSE
jgi:glycosyltransferase involved in cell wall biosynthesis